MQSKIALLVLSIMLLSAAVAVAAGPASDLDGADEIALSQATPPLYISTSVPSSFPAGTAHEFVGDN